MATNWYFFYQRDGKESPWDMGLSSDRHSIVKSKRPVFTTVLDLSGVPDDNDWSKTRYQGPLYFDFDADGDLDEVCDKFTAFIAKLEVELDFDASQAYYYCSGSKGFHIEIPQECFIPKVSAAGYPWLPYVYREVAQSLYVDTLDLKVYTGKRGRMWRTPNVERENGCFKVPISFAEAMSMTPDMYLDLIKEKREADSPMLPTCNTKFALLFDRARDKITAHMRGRKKRQEKAVAFLEPWKAAKKTPPTIEALMAGENVAEGAGFQNIAMQLAIYATSVGMELPEFLDRCRGLCENHVSDSKRYNSENKRRIELQRMHEYMGENTLYDFELAPIIKLVKKGTPTPDLGVTDTEDRGDAPAPRLAEGDTADGDPATSGEVIHVDFAKGVRRGFYMSAEGMYRKIGDITEPVCRATLRKVEGLTDLESAEFKGYEFDLVVNERVIKRTVLSADTFTSSQKMRQFMANHQLSYQGGEQETSALLDIMAEKAVRNGNTFVYPREGFFIIESPVVRGEMVKVFLTQDTFQTSVPKDDHGYFKLRYKPVHAVSGYNIDIHQAPKLDESMIPALADFLSFNRDDVLADLIGWFVACHYRSFYLHFFGQFPLLHIYGEAGAGKTKSVEVLARLHWLQKAKVSIKSAVSSTNFALDVDASTSTSCPMIVDEWKPKEMRVVKGRYEKLKDVLKASYVGSDIGNRGTLNKGAESTLGVIKSKATAPIAFMAEAIETETAIFERSIVVGLSQDLHKGNKHRTQAFNRLYDNTTAVSALGRAIVEMGFGIDTDKFKEEMNTILRYLEEDMPNLEDDTQRRAAPRLIFNRAVIIHSLSIMKRVLNMAFGPVFDTRMDEIMGSRRNALRGEEGAISRMQGMSEISKVISQLALLTRMRDEPWELRNGKDYVVGDGWVELKIESCFDRYRRHCVAHHAVPLFDNLESLVYAFGTYSPTLDRICANSELRDDGSTERIVRLSTEKLRKEGVQTFRA